MQQLSFIFDIEQGSALKGLVKECTLRIKKKYPRPVVGESLEDYELFIRDEILLDISERLKEIALSRQKKSISVLFHQFDNKGN